MKDEVVRYLNVRPGGTYIDATLGMGGHAKELLRHMRGDGRVLGIEYDETLAKKLRTEHISGLIIEEGNYCDMEHFIQKHNLNLIDGILFDFGMNSWHVDASGRGFSFLKDEPLDMRFSRELEITAAALVNMLSESELASIFRRYGEEPHARRVAHTIVIARRNKRIITTSQLVGIIGGARAKYGGKHPATKVFQALRIAVNHELENVRKGLEVAMRCIGHGGRIVAISFHSLEDRIVKNMFSLAGGGVRVTRRVIVPSHAEIVANPRARSAKFRVWERT